jgi:hypothetical protein
MPGRRSGDPREKAARVLEKASVARRGRGRAMTLEEALAYAREEA